ncbi:MAG: hypothetical protein WCH98_19980 [Verrucomicrobiota bacterium]
MKTRKRKQLRVAQRRRLGQTLDPEFNWVKEVCGETMAGWREVAVQYTLPS